MFENGIVNLSSWLGNVILPTLSGLFFAIAIIRFVGPGQHQNWMYGGFLCLMASGILRSLEFFSSQQAWNDPDLYWMSLVNLVNWTCNVIMPLCSRERGDSLGRGLTCLLARFAPARRPHMAYRIAGIDVHKRMLAVVITGYRLSDCPRDTWRTTSILHVS